MSGNFYKQYKIFVSSPGDVSIERKKVDLIVSQINDSIGDSLKINIKVEMWEKEAPITTLESVQESLNEKIKDCNFFLLILYKRYGSIEEGYDKSNTEREIDTIVEHISKNDKKTILSFFKVLKPNEDPGEQEQKIRDLRERLKTKKWFYADYKDTNDFVNQLTHSLYRIILRMHSSSFKVEQLKKFWKGGKFDGQAIPRMSIVYPPVSKTKMSNGLVTNLWQTRLLPHIYFEDFKALHKILKNLSMAGHQDYKVYSKFDLPHDIDQSNVIWICLPRLRKGLDELKKQKNKRFDIIVPKSQEAEASIKWQTETGNIIVVKSPLRKYLKHQRLDVDSSQDWDRSLNNIIVKDYAIIARFDRPLTQDNPGMEKLKSFYIAGIHGLGTWGATWFIDRRYGYFRDKPLDGSIQMLVEVEYKNGRIVAVTDVSEKDKEYFDSENSSKTINTNIRNYKEEYS